MGRIIDELAMIYGEIDWRRKNRHNKTSIANSFIRSCVEVGKNTYGKIFAITSNPSTKLHIGNYCSIGPNVIFLVSGGHTMENISTYPFKVYCLNHDSENIIEPDMWIDDDVWIGTNAIILSGVHIGQGAVVGAGSIVTKDIPPYAIVAGNPARIIRYRFREEIVSELLKVNFGLLTEDLILQYKEELYSTLTNVSQLKWLPHKDL